MLGRQLSNASSSSAPPSTMTPGTVLDRLLVLGQRSAGLKVDHLDLDLDLIEQAPHPPQGAGGLRRSRWCGYGWTVSWDARPPTGRGGPGWGVTRGPDQVRVSPEAQRGRSRFPRQREANNVRAKLLARDRHRSPTLSPT